MRAATNYRPELDGLRAIAILMVVVGHAGFFGSIANVGVTAFFVLSGYLITTLLVAEQSRTGRIDLRRFYARRIRRLLPALVALLVVVASIGIVGAWSRPWETGVLSSALYVGNWARVVGLDLGPLGHMWSLAIEEQFYTLWPAALILLGRRRSGWVAGVGVGLAFVGRALLDGDAENYGTLTRADAILVGCSVALAGISASRGIGWVSLAVLTFVALVPLPPDMLLPAATWATAGFIVGGAPGIAWLAPLGRRAYSLYLWNYPLTVLLGGGFGSLCAFAAAEASYRFVERPFLRSTTNDRHPVVEVFVAAAR